ncbi:MAG: KUP/HAK/KT family potassium transporter [Chromatiaceae bacterium]|nr:KUP/HAK/KT family potassium transporter [Chromatiaceae bacterium]MCP5314471.1 KUP/HAK/KT family potassium transporter [Chromatiaceae bacterium]
MKLGRPKWRDSVALAALGVVFGDIGTSPIYTMNVVFSPDSGIDTSAANILGILSLVFWSLLLIVTMKYMVFVIKADHDGDGGVIALATLLGKGQSGRRSRWLLLGVIASALLIADSMLTPAISVLSAVQGLELISPRVEPYVPQIAGLILLSLFLVQRHGTATIGALFGPTMALWFVTIGGLGLAWILKAPSVLQAVDPRYAFAFLSAGGWEPFLILGSIFLVVTGSEALYADLGHFGRTPIRHTWWYLVWPSLLLNYFGQGALLLSNAYHPVNSFFAMAPPSAVAPLLLLATIATVIASQAVITGAFSLFKQLVELDYFPRLQLTHTSALQEGQVYVPTANWLLMSGALALVLLFQSPDSLAGAYGLAIGGVTLITSLLYLRYFRTVLDHRLPGTLALGSLLLSMDMTFLGALLFKLASGAVVVLIIGGLLLLVMLAWHWGQQRVRENRQWLSPSIKEFLADAAVTAAGRADGTALFLTHDPAIVPLSLAKNFRHNRILHRENYLLAIDVQDRPRVPLDQKLSIDKLGRGFFSVIFRTGYMERPTFATVRSLLNQSAYPVGAGDLSIFVSRIRLGQTGAGTPGAWRSRLFDFLVRNSPGIARHLGVPEHELVEIGTTLGCSRDQSVNQALPVDYAHPSP